MEEYYFEMPVTNSKVLCVGSITRAESETSDHDAEFCDGYGYYLFFADAEAPRSDIQIVAKLLSEDAAAQFVKLLRFSGHKPAPRPV